MSIGYSALPLATPAVYILFTKLVDITGPKKSRDKVETTNHDNTSRKKSFIPAFLGTGDPTFKVQFQKSWKVQLDSMVESGTTFGWQIGIPDGAGGIIGSTLAFSAFVSDLGDMTPLKDLIECDITLCIIDSTVTFTPAT